MHNALETKKRHFGQQKSSHPFRTFPEQKNVMRRNKMATTFLINEVDETRSFY